MSSNIEKPVPGSVRPPLGLLPYRLWVDFHPYPDYADIAERVADVTAAIDRYDAANKIVSDEWRFELAYWPAHLRAFSDYFGAEADTPHVVEH